MSVSTFHSDGTPFNLVFGMMYCFRQCYFSNRKVNDFIKCLYICVMDIVKSISIVINHTHVCGLSQIVLKIHNVGHTIYFFIQF